MTMSEKVYIIQPIESPKVQILHEEAISLIESAGAEYAGTTFQNIREINAATYIGAGKLQEIHDVIADEDYTVLFNGELSPSQMLNISEALGKKKVIDRTTLILDIFALRAESSEGKIQVELAQLKYIYPRLRGKGSSLSRLGGGIGTRGPGESKLETDRRHIKERIRALEEKLRNTEKRRAMRTQRRKKDRVRTVALVGYTNTGKSTLMNALTGANVLVQNALFATLDPTSRAFEIDGVPLLLVDTVGFLQDLPHNLIEAFKSTLESALCCDLALVVCDAGGDYQTQLDTTLSTLKDLGFQSPYLVVMNKCDGVEDTLSLSGDVQISAKTGAGLEHLKTRILEALKDEYLTVRLFVPYSASADYALIRSKLFERSVVYGDEGTEIEAVVPAESAFLCRSFIRDNPSGRE